MSDELIKELEELHELRKKKVVINDLIKRLQSVDDEQFKDWLNR